MTSSHIEIRGTASRYSSFLRHVIDDARTFQQNVIKAKDIIDQIANDNDWIALADALGTSVAEAETIYNLLTALNAGVSNASLMNNFIDRLG